LRSRKIANNSPTAGNTIAAAKADWNPSVSAESGTSHGYPVCRNAVTVTGEGAEH
jgi:hypothetical protein